MCKWPQTDMIPSNRYACAPFTYVSACKQMASNTIWHTQKREYDIPKRDFLSGGRNTILSSPGICNPPLVVLSGSKVAVILSRSITLPSPPYINIIRKEKWREKNKCLLGKSFNQQPNLCIRIKFLFLYTYSVNSNLTSILTVNLLKIKEQIYEMVSAERMKFIRN